jgi:hypothetical protein
MPTVSPYFNNFSSYQEQGLLEDLIIESIRIYGEAMLMIQSMVKILCLHMRRLMRLKFTLRMLMVSQEMAISCQNLALKFATKLCSLLLKEDLLKKLVDLQSRYDQTKAI